MKDKQGDLWLVPRDECLMVRYSGVVLQGEWWWDSVVIKRGPVLVKPGTEGWVMSWRGAVGDGKKGGQLATDLRLATLVRESGMPNVYGLRIPVASTWNFRLLASLVNNSSDREVVLFLRYGWPLNREMPVPLTCTYGNHAGATQHASAVEDYIHKELALGGLVGPLRGVPWLGRVTVSPMTTRPKKKSSKRRVITDLSWPVGSSVNDGIPKQEYMGVYQKVRYPTVDQLCKRAVTLSQGRPKGQVKGFKVDLNRAFRQIPLCPRDWSLMGTYWDGFVYFDKVTVMGSRTGPLACQRVTNMIRHIMGDIGFEVKNFVDDFMGIELLDKVWDSFYTLRRLLKDLGVSEAEDKAVLPTYIVEFLGILFNLWMLTMEIPEDKVLDLLEDIGMWMRKSLTTRKQVERLLGKLQFAATCVRPGRVFVSRIIDELKEMTDDGLHVISGDMKLDLQWWKAALVDRNEVCMMWLEQVDVEKIRFCTDACLEGVGAVRDDRCFRHDIPDKYLRSEGWSIVHYEFLAVIIAVQVWQDWLKGKRVVIRCDNQAVVMVINTGRAKDRELQRLLRWLCYLLTVIDALIRLEYVETRSNDIADKLSRSCLGPRQKRDCDELIRNRNLTEEVVKNWYFDMMADW